MRTSRAHCTAALPGSAPRTDTCSHCLGMARARRLTPAAAHTTTAGCERFSSTQLQEARGAARGTDPTCAAASTKRSATHSNAAAECPRPQTMPAIVVVQLTGATNQNSEIRVRRATQGSPRELKTRSSASLSRSQVRGHTRQPGAGQQGGCSCRVSRPSPPARWPAVARARVRTVLRQVGSQPGKHRVCEANPIESLAPSDGSAQCTGGAGERAGAVARGRGRRRRWSTRR